LAEWLYEEGIGENRAILVEGDAILAAEIELPASGPRVGAILAARLADSRTGQLVIDGGEALLSSVPKGLAEGARLKVEIVREAWPERGRTKPAKAILAARDADLDEGPDLFARLSASGFPVNRPQPHEPDAFEEAGWSELLDEAAHGNIAFPGGQLRMAVTPAMILFDVDGDPPLPALAVAAAAAVAQAIVRHGITGSIGVDFPTLAGRAERQAVGAAIDASLPQPFERTAMNGFGFLQIVRRRARPSLPEQLRRNPGGAAARAALRAAERLSPPGPHHHIVGEAAFRWLAANPECAAELERRTGMWHGFAVAQRD
jgi:hypothetical protein